MLGLERLSELEFWDEVDDLDFILVGREQVRHIRTGDEASSH